MGTSGMAGALADPTLELYDSKGGLIASNDNWRDRQQAAFAEGGRYHAFQPTNDLESAIAVTLQPGAYTTIIRGKNDTIGIGLAELYDYSRNAGSKLANISTRAWVQSGDNIMIGGLIIIGQGNTKMLLRVLGPSLIPNGITDAMADPTLELYNSSGTRIAFDDNWRDNSTQAGQIVLSGVAPTNLLESAIVTTLVPGSYTAVVRGKNDTAGVALFELYDIP